MIPRLKRLVPHHFPPRLWYHKGRALIAGIRHGFPAKSMRVIGITGTNGKTTTTTLAAEMLAASGRKVAMATSIQFRIGDRVWDNETHKTTLSPGVLQAFLRAARDAGCDDLVLEVSSHALVQGRLLGIPFQTAAFTNLSPEHLDYHKTMDRYRKAKELLFRKLGGKPGTVSVVNGDDEQAHMFLALPAERTWVTHVEGAPLRSITLPQTRRLIPLEAAELRTSLAATSFVLRWEGNELPVSMKLLGRFNVENAAMAAAIALANGVDPEHVRAVLERVEIIPGRLEPVDAGQPFRAVIDYAVTPDALEKLYDTLRPLTPGRIIAVFGACGDRDRGKRPSMGRAGAEKADVLILTNEEPYGEEPLSIIEALARGVRGTGKEEGKDYFIIPDRKAAIEQAVRMAAPGDTVAVSGMGNQTSMVWGEKTIPWSDREELRESISRAGADKG
jgi:UDP-N-acetylmuramoyl-L-alanyl-D-glutamate--2,6-diaminopimelate ligase